MSAFAQSWDDFYESCPDRVKDVIDNGPKPLADYGYDSMSYADKKRGMMRFKGGNGRNTRVQMKSGMAAVVYFDPTFAEPPVENVPDSVESRHSEKEVTDVFKLL
jgi:hypothetical protein